MAAEGKAQVRGPTLFLCLSWKETSLQRGPGLPETWMSTSCLPPSPWLLIRLGCYPWSSRSKMAAGSRAQPSEDAPKAPAPAIAPPWSSTSRSLLLQHMKLCFKGRVYKVLRTSHLAPKWVKGGVTRFVLVGPRPPCAVTWMALQDLRLSPPHPTPSSQNLR